MLTRKSLVIAGLVTTLLAGSAYAAARAPDVAPTDGAIPSTWSGTYVSFAYDAESGAITDYARLVDGEPVVLFERIAFADHGDAKSRQAGRVLLARDGNDTRAAFFDARNAAFAMSSPDGNVVTLTVAEGIDLAYHEAEENWSPEGVLLTMGNRTARLVVRGDADVQVDGRNVTVALGPHAGLLFKVDGHKWEEVKERAFLLKLHKHLAKRGEDGATRGEEMRELARARRGGR